MIGIRLKKLRKLFRERQRRFRDAVNAAVNRFIRDCHNMGVSHSEIFMGDLRRIRKNNHGKKVNPMVHNFWSHGYLKANQREGRGVQHKSETRR